MTYEKKNVGIIVAIEMDAIYKLYPDLKEVEAPRGYKLFLVEKERVSVYVLQTGMGEIAAAAGVQYLASACRVSAIFNFGVVGGLTGSMKKHKICLVNRVVHYKYDCSEFMDLVVGQVDGHDSIFLKTDETLLRDAQALMDDLMPVTCCSGDKFISTPEEKTYLHETFEGDICDMESAGIVLACEMNQVPCLLLKAVSDGLADGAAGFYNELQSASLSCLQVADQIIEKLAYKDR